MRALLLALLAGCSASQPAKTLTAPDLAQTVADGGKTSDMATSATADLASGSDFATSVDLAIANDLATAGADLACGYPIGTLCTLNAQCTCSTKICDLTGDGHTRCCVIEGHACIDDTDCCERMGSGNGVCSGGLCQPG